MVTLGPVNSYETAYALVWLAFGEAWCGCVPSAEKKQNGVALCMRAYVLLVGIKAYLGGCIFAGFPGGMLMTTMSLALSLMPSHDTNERRTFWSIGY